MTRKKAATDEAVQMNSGHEERTLMQSIAEVQRNMPAIVKNRTAGAGTKFEYKYADLAEVLDKILPLVAAEGITTTGNTVFKEDGHMMVRTFLTKGEEVLSIDWPAGHISMKPQDLGACTTYARRYGISTLLQIASEEDTDGNVSSEAPTKQQAMERRQPPPRDPKLREELEAKLANAETEEVLMAAASEIAQTKLLNDRDRRELRLIFNDRRLALQNSTQEPEPEPETEQTAAAEGAEIKNPDDIYKTLSERLINASDEEEINEALDAAEMAKSEGDLFPPDLEKLKALAAARRDLLT